MKTRLMLFAVVLGLQSAWILGTTAKQEHALKARTVLLETRPVDPRDLLSGDFVILNYKISDLPLTLFDARPSDGFAPGQQVFVVLEARNDFHEPVSASTRRVQPKENQVVIRGTVHNRWRGAQDSTVHLEYGLERFYVREGTGNPTGKLTVLAAVSVSGKANIKEVYVDGLPYAEAMRDHQR